MSDSRVPTSTSTPRTAIPVGDPELLLRSLLDRRPDGVEPPFPSCFQGLLSPFFGISMLDLPTPRCPS
ncbi:MAG: hypothetical protein JXB32_08735 [Deltaproteobacteria bacterium]|nr:hypothetical protein [Deltaproteobacteria bacterium]